MEFPIKLLITFVLANIIQFAAAADEAQEFAVLALNCLREVTIPGLSHGELLAKVEHYSTWSAVDEEEIPCFTLCLLRGRGYDIEKGDWQKQSLVDLVGADVYNYCRYELARHRRNACEMAHRGLRCLQQAEEQLKRSHNALLACVEEQQTPMSELLDYAVFKTPERIPCLFKCFAEKMEFYNGSDYAWHYDNWVRAFGPMKSDDVDLALSCKASAETIASRPMCEWMYEEYMCLERLNYNTDGTSVPSSPLTTTMQSLLRTQTEEKGRVEDTTQKVADGAETTTNETPATESGNNA